MKGDSLDIFLDLVRIDSPTRRESQVCAWCAAALAELGFTVEIDDSASVTGSDTGNLIATLPGVECDATLILSAHLDCVDPCTGVIPVVEDGIVRSEGSTVLGADDKAGITAILVAAARAVRQTGQRPNLKVVLTTAEESGLAGAKALPPHAFDGDVCLVLDAAGDSGSIVVGAPTHHTFAARFVGVASHAGIAPEKGRSALEMAAQAVSVMQLGRIDEHTTANIGTIEGGTATNVVPALATVTGECRSLVRTRAEEVRAAMDRAMREAAEAFGGIVEIEWSLEYDGFVVADDSAELKLVSDACRDAGFTPTTFMTGGGSDGNIFAAAGVPTFVLGCGMQDAHSIDEHIAIKDIDGVAEIVSAVIARMAKG